MGRALRLEVHIRDTQWCGVRPGAVSDFQQFCEERNAGRGSQGEGEVRSQADVQCGNGRMSRRRRAMKMKTSRLRRIGAVAITVATISFGAGGRFLPGPRGVQAAVAAEKTARVSAMAGAFAPSA